MKKQIASILTAAFILGVLSGCSSGTEGSGANSGSSSTSEKTSTSSSSFSEETSNSSNEISLTEQKAFYDNIFEDFIEENPALIGAPMTYDDVMAVMTDPMHGGLDSYYLVEAVELLKLSDCEKLRGFEDWFYRINGVKFDNSNNYDGYDYGSDVIYKVRIIKDLITGEDCSKEIYTDLYISNPMHQKAGNPPYAPGEKFTIALFNKAEDSDITQSGAGYFFRFDVDDNNDNLTALVRKENSEICASKLVEMTKISKSVVTSTTKNPVQYVAELNLSDFVDFLRKDWEDREVSHYEKT